LGTREEIRAEIMRAGYTMSEVVSILNEKYCRSNSVSNLGNKLRRNSLRYFEAKEIAEAIGYKIVWVKDDKYTTKA